MVEKILFALAIFLSAGTGSFVETLFGVRKSVTITKEGAATGNLGVVTLTECFEIASAVLVPNAPASFTVRAGNTQYLVTIEDESSSLAASLEQSQPSA